jgi:hypothetical protein
LDNEEWRRAEGGRRTQENKSKFFMLIKAVDFADCKNIILYIFLRPSSAVLPLIPDLLPLLMAHSLHLKRIRSQFE